MKLLLFLILVLSPAWAQPTMLKMVVRNATPGLNQKSFVAQPRTIYRTGNTHARVEEKPNPKDGVHLVLIRAGTQSWAYDRKTHTARHSGNLPADVRLPIFMLTDGSYVLEFGREVEFMEINQVSPTEVKSGSGIMKRYTVKSGDRFIELLTKNGRPIFTQMRDGRGKILMRILYDEFTPNLPNQPDLYKLPKGAKVKQVTD